MRAGRDRAEAAFRIEAGGCYLTLVAGFGPFAPQFAGNPRPVAVRIGALPVPSTRAFQNFSRFSVPFAGQVASI